MSRRTGIPRRLAAETMALVLGPRQTRLVQRPQRVEFGLDVEGQVFDRGVEQPAAGFEDGAADLFILVFDHYFIDAVFRRLASTAVAGVDADQALDLQRDVLEDVPLVRAGPQPLEEAAPVAQATAMFDHRGQPGHQPLIEAGQDVRGRVLQFLEIDPSLKDRKVCPNVWSAKCQDLPKFHDSSRSRMPKAVCAPSSRPPMPPWHPTQRRVGK